MSIEEIRELEKKIQDLTGELRKKQAELKPETVPDYQFDTLYGKVALSEVFGSKDRLLVIHSMGQACRYCTLWADGINAFIPHLESAMSVVLVSKDSPETQRQLANSRRWRFRMASHSGGVYQSEQVAGNGMDNAPGVVCYEKSGNEIVRRASSYFGPGDLYCSMWNFLGVAGIDVSGWTPQYNYWIRPENLEDGGDSVLG